MHAVLQCTYRNEKIIAQSFWVDVVINTCLEKSKKNSWKKSKFENVLGFLHSHHVCSEKLGEVEAKSLLKVPKTPENLT